MPIRIITEEVVIRCSDEELPRAIAALRGQLPSDTHLYLESQVNKSEVYLLPNRETVPSRNLARRRLTNG